MPKKTLNSNPNFTQFLPEVSDKLQTVVDAYLENYNEHYAFDYLIAELFETTQPDKFYFTDGPRDGGIDFFVRDSQTYTICQCKCPEMETLNESDIPQSFDQGPVDELRAAIDMLMDKTGEYDVKPEIKRLRGDFQRDLAADPEVTQLTAILAVLGTLSSPAKKVFESYKNALSRSGIKLKLIEWKNIFHALHSLESPSDINFDIQINFDSPKDILRQDDYCYVLANAYDFYAAFRKHEWNLFEWNVRYQIPNSPINKRIVRTLSSSSRKKFHHFNNGLLITCRTYRIDNRQNHITLTGPQIINGCQTVRAICEAYDNLSPQEQEDFRAKTRVQVKVIKTTELDFISQLVISTNDQNPMNPRNLKSNSTEQREIQKMLRALPEKWFFQRKDGEFKSLLTASSRVDWFRKSDFAATPRNYRVIDNEELAKVWYSFIGNSNSALRGGHNYFSDEEDGPYSMIFKSIPNPSFWSAFSEPLFQINTKYFEPGTPQAYQYLLAYSIARYIDQRRISYRTIRIDAIKRGIRTRALNGDISTGKCTNSPKEIDLFLSKDIDYYLNVMLNNMREVLIELFSYTLTSKYTTLDAQTSQQLLMNFPFHKAYVTGGYNLADLCENDIDNCVFGPIYDFLVDCLRQYYYEFEAEIRSSPRLKSYLAQRDTINKLRTKLSKRNETIIGFDAPWKKCDKTFIGSLPNI